MYYSRSPHACDFNVGHFPFIKSYSGLLNLISIELDKFLLDMISLAVSIPLQDGEPYLNRYCLGTLGCIAV